MNIFLMKTINFSDYRLENAIPLNLCVKAKSIAQAQVSILKYLFKDELQNVDSSTLSKLEQISSYSDQFHEMVSEMNNPKISSVDPKDFGFDNILIGEVPELDKAKIVVHEAVGEKRKMYVNGKVIILNKIQTISKRTFKSKIPSLFQI
jgi:hypothetical protein